MLFINCLLGVCIEINEVRSRDQSCAFRFRLDVVVSARQVPVQFVETVLEVHRRFSELVNSLFHGDKHFVSALDLACTAIVNHREPKQPCRAPDLVMFFDVSLKSGNNRKVAIRKTILSRRSKNIFFSVCRL